MGQIIMRASHVICLLARRNFKDHENILYEIAVFFTILLNNETFLAQISENACREAHFLPKILEINFHSSPWQVYYCCRSTKSLRPWSRNGSTSRIHAWLLHPLFYGCPLSFCSFFHFFVSFLSFLIHFHSSSIYFKCQAWMWAQNLISSTPATSTPDVKRLLTDC